MGLPATTLALPVLDFGWLLERLPPAARAQLIWAKKPIDDGIARLRNEEPTDALLDDVANTLRRPFFTGLGKAYQAIAGLETTQEAIEQELEAEHERLRALASDDDAKDTVDWIMEFFHALMDEALDALESVDASVELSSDQLDLPVLSTYLRGSIALMAVSDIAKQPSVPPETIGRAHELLDVVFLEFMEFSDQMAEVVDVPFEPPSSAPTHLGERMAFYAQGVRNTLADEDWEQIERARLRNLR